MVQIITNILQMTLDQTEIGNSNLELEPLNSAKIPLLHNRVPSPPFLPKHGYLLHSYLLLNSSEALSCYRHVYI